MEKTKADLTMQPPAQIDVSSLFKCVDEELSRVKELLENQITSCPGKVGIGELLEYIGSYRGKMLRPGLVLISGSSCGGLNDEHIRVASIIELIHNATLLHDDVIDEGQKRRGVPTVNHLWGNESAVLLGDFLLSRVFGMCAQLPPAVVEVISAGTMQVCEGELRQIVQKRNWNLSESDYIDTIKDKSASLFSTACKLGAMLAQADERKTQLLTNYGLNLGIAFQITDDLLDITGSENETGKTLGSDAETSKPTLPVIHLLRTLDDKGSSELVERLNDPLINKPDLLQMLEKAGSLVYARDKAGQFIAQATDSLEDLDESKYKEALIKTTEFVLARIN
ncbi:MAG: polyprenyl synthetase family protein [Planctomycetota bacterium]|jgi:octaprenyl-diphosphate synthase